MNWNRSHEGYLIFSQIPPAFPEQTMWGAVLADRWTFAIVHQPEIGYTATWKDSKRDPHQAIRIGGDFRTLGAAKRACEAQASGFLQ